MRSVSDIFRSYAVLDSEGRHTNGTDKMSNHNYGMAYERIIDTNFSLFSYGAGIQGRDTVKLMMEVGIADGASLLAWREIFPQALCVGMDIHSSQQAHGDRIEFHLGDQCSLEDCQRAVGGRKFDFIVEDATHLLENSLRTLLYLWPAVRPGGIYVIEEFANIGALRTNIGALWHNVRVYDTVGPFGGVEPLVVFRKHL